MENAKSIASRELDGSERLIDTDWFARRLWRLEIDLIALEQTIFRFVSDVMAGKTLGAETSLLKARGTEVRQGICDLLSDAAGYYGLPFEQDVFAVEQDETYFGAEDLVTLAGERYSSRGGSIAGGTAEVQAMVTAKRVLGL